MKPTYDNSYNRNRVRIDTRNQADPAVQAGMRKIHRGMDGGVIGGVTAEGSAIGTKAGASGYRSALSRPAAPVGGAAAPVASPAPASPTAPRTSGGGLSRWEALNPNAKAAFSAGSPANSKSTNRRMLMAQSKAAPGFTNTPSLASMPKRKTWDEATALPKARTGRRGMTMDQANSYFPIADR